MMLLPKNYNDAFEFVKGMGKILLVCFWGQYNVFALLPHNAC